MDLRFCYSVFTDSFYCCKYCVQQSMSKRKKITKRNVSLSHSMLKPSELGNIKHSSVTALHEIGLVDHDYYNIGELPKRKREKVMDVQSSESNDNLTVPYVEDRDQIMGNTANSKRSFERKSISRELVSGSKSINSAPTMKSKCISKNAINARINRLKKKSYVQSLEYKIADLTTKNEELNTYIQNQINCISSLRAEVAYLRGVISNMSEIKSLLRSVRHHSDLEVTSSLFEDSKCTSVTQDQIKINTAVGETPNGG